MVDGGREISLFASLERMANGKYKMGNIDEFKKEST